MWPLALLTKATAYLFAPWLLAAVFVARAKDRSKRMIAGALFAALCAAGLDTPHYVRNYHRQIPMLLSSMANAVSKKRIAKGTGVA